MNPADLFRRRLLVVAGKGGVGKTTVACALALEGARRGLRILLCEVDGLAGTAHLLHVPPPDVGSVAEASPGVFIMRVDGRAALAEYLGMVVPVRRLLDAVFRSRIYHYFVAAAPGLKELMTIGKIWYEAEGVQDASGGHKWDLVIFDAPATGHSLQYLRMPAAARDAFSAGLVHREAQRLVELLTDPARTAINLVATAEELPVNETIGMYRQLRDLRMPTGVLFVNRVHTTDFADADIERLRSAVARRREERERVALAEMAARAREEAGWTRVNARYRARLAEQVEMPLVQIPFLFSEEFSLAEVREIAAHLRREVPATGRRERRA
jgi:anion-transporting  ArsA/GET3 family ATPase